jgi:hypothetical protein
MKKSSIRPATRTGKNLPPDILRAAAPRRRRGPGLKKPAVKILI